MAGEWGWAIAFVLAVLLLRAWAWYARRQAERRRYAQGVQALYAGFRQAADPHAIAHSKVNVLATDCNHILTLAHKGERYSRRVMKRHYGISQRRWNAATRLLKEIQALPLGIQKREESYRRLQQRIHELHEAANVVDVLPFD